MQCQWMWRSCRDGIDLYSPQSPEIPTIDSLGLRSTCMGSNQCSPEDHESLCEAWGFDLRNTLCCNEALKVEVNLVMNDCLCWEMTANMWKVDCDFHGPAMKLYCWRATWCRRDWLAKDFCLVHVEYKAHPLIYFSEAISNGLELDLWARATAYCSSATEEWVTFVAVCSHCGLNNCPSVLKIYHFHRRLVEGEMQHWSKKDRGNDTTFSSLRLV